MRYLFTLLILFFLLYSNLPCYSQKPYSIGHAKIEYTFSNGIQTGTKVLTFNDSGTIEKEDVFSVTDTAKSRLVFPDSSIHLQVKNHTAVIQTLDSVFNINYTLNTYNSRLKFTVAGLVDKEKKKVGEGLFLGKKCDIFRIDVLKIWYWKGLALKKEIDMGAGGKWYEYAIKIDENYVPEDDEFIIPKEIKLN